MRPRTLDELAALCGAVVEGDGSRQVGGPAGLDDAGPDEISFLAQSTYAPKLATTRAGAVLVPTDLAVEREDLALLRCENPEVAFTEIILAFAPVIPAIAEGVAAQAVVDATAEVAPGARVAAHVTIGPHARVAAGAVLHAGVRVGAHATIGEGSTLYPNVVLYPYTQIGERCVVHGGAILGGDGLGFRFEDGAWVKTPQVGNVVIEDDVEIGANVTIDCARFGSTTIGAGTKIDNLVHIAHNVRTGRHCLLLAQVGIAGSTSLGHGVILAGQVGVAGHVHIGDGARIGAQSGIAKDVAPGQDMFGSPAGPSREKMKSMFAAERAGKNIARLRREMQALTQVVEDLRSKIDSGTQDPS